MQAGKYPGNWTVPDLVARACAGQHHLREMDSWQFFLSCKLCVYRCDGGGHACLCAYRCDGGGHACLCVCEHYYYATALSFFTRAII